MGLGKGSSVGLGKGSGGGLGKGFNGGLGKGSAAMTRAKGPVCNTPQGRNYSWI